MHSDIYWVICFGDTKFDSKFDTKFVATCCFGNAVKTNIIANAWFTILKNWWENFLDWWRGWSHTIRTTEIFYILIIFFTRKKTQLKAFYSHCPCCFYCFSIPLYWTKMSDQVILFGEREILIEPNRNSQFFHLCQYSPCDWKAKKSTSDLSHYLQPDIVPKWHRVQVPRLWIPLCCECVLGNQN